MTAVDQAAAEAGTQPISGAVSITLAVLLVVVIGLACWADLVVHRARRARRRRSADRALRLAGRDRAGLRAGMERGQM